MKLKLVTIALASVIGTMSAAALAEEPTVYVMPAVGYMNTDSELSADDDVAYGLRIGKALSKHWDVQLGLTHSKADAEGALNGAQLGGDYRQTLFGVDALYMFSRDKFRPFLLAGLGAARNKVNYSTVGNADIGSSNTSFMGNVGAGFQYLFNDKVGMQADLRHVWSRAEDSSRALFGNSNSKETIGNTLLNIGLLFNFGMPKPAVAEPEPEPVSMLSEISPVDDEPLPPLMEEPVGPAEPVFVRMTLAAEVLFDFDKANLKDEGMHILDVEVVEKMLAHPEVELVLITGHTDFIGDSQYNQNLSERRAQAVKDYISSMGVYEGRLHAVGMGENDPVVDCSGIRGKQLVDCLQPNRRVVVEIEAQRQIAQ